MVKFESGFTKREFVLTVESVYPEEIKFELLKEKCSLLDQFNTGDQVKVSFNIRGREWQGKYFTNLQVRRLCEAAPPLAHADRPPAGVAPRADRPLLLWPRRYAGVGPASCVRPQAPRVQARPGSGPGPGA